MLVPRSSGSATWLDGLLVALERTIGRQRQSPGRVRCDQRPVVFEERDVLLDRSQRPLDRRRRLVDVDLDVVDRKLGRLEQIQRRADDELGLARLDLDERVDDRVELEFVRAHDLRARGGTGKETHAASRKPRRFISLLAAGESSRRLEKLNPRQPALMPGDAGRRTHESNGRKRSLPAGPRISCNCRCRCPCRCRCCTRCA